MASDVCRKEPEWRHKCVCSKLRNWKRRLRSIFCKRTYWHCLQWTSAPHCLRRWIATKLYWYWLIPIKNWQEPYQRRKLTASLLLSILFDDRIILDRIYMYLVAYSGLNLTSILLMCCETHFKPKASELHLVCGKPTGKPNKLAKKWLSG